jgi:type VI protein secretion system component VasK
MNVLLWVIGLAASAAAIWQFWEFKQQQYDDIWPHLVLTGVFAGVACVCAGIFFFKKFKEEGDQDISITKF